MLQQTISEKDVQEITVTISRYTIPSSAKTDERIGCAIWKDHKKVDASHQVFQAKLWQEWHNILLPRHFNQVRAIH